MMVLVERREMIENFLKEVVSLIDFELYSPLNKFLLAKENLTDLKHKVTKIVKYLRQRIARNKLNAVRHVIKY